MDEHLLTQDWRYESGTSAQLRQNGRAGLLDGWALAYPRLELWVGAFDGLELRVGAFDRTRQNGRTGMRDRGRDSAPG